MPSPLTIADPERALVVAYAPARLRPGLATLWKLDERLGAIVAQAREPMVGEIRLAWWREALEALDTSPAPAEPLLQEVARTLMPAISGTELAAIEEGWAALLAGPIPDEQAMLRHGQLRGGRLFALAARLLTGAESGQAVIAGEGWALADLGSRLSDARAASTARGMAADRLAELAGYRWPVPLRPLGALAVLARRDAAAVGPRCQASPGRVARLLLHRLSGR